MKAPATSPRQKPPTPPSLIPHPGLIDPGRQHVGYLYRLPNRRIEAVLLPEGLVRLQFRRLLSREQAAAFPESGSPATSRAYLRGRVLYQELAITPDALSCLGHFRAELLTSPGALSCRPVVLPAPSQP